MSSFWQRINTSSYLRKLSAVASSKKIEMLSVVSLSRLSPNNGADRVFMLFPEKKLSPPFMLKEIISHWKDV